jgi:hypothetical protein
MTYPDQYRIMLAKMGYYDYQNGLINNHLQQEGRWDSHLENCRGRILEEIDRLMPDIVTVFGSGWLLDLPLAEMLERSCKINLVDIVHPPEVASQLKNKKEVTLIETDATGGLIKEVWDQISGFSFLKKDLNIAGIEIPDYKPEFETGLIISLNLTTQLEARIISYITKRTGMKSEELTDFKKKVQESHLKFLRENDSLLISDYEEHVRLKSGETRITATMLAEITDEEVIGRWDWDFDLTGRENYNSTIIFKELAAHWTKTREGDHKGRVSP